MFFPSYNLMETFYEEFTNSNILNLIESHKMLLKEPKDPELFPIVMKNYYENIYGDN
jgi:hypothetical protein